MDPRTPEGRQVLGRRIQSAIAQAGYESLSAFARELDCSRALIYQYANGDVLVQVDRLQTIGDLTGKPLEWFFLADPNGDSAVVLQLKARADAAEEQARALRDALARERGTRLEGTQQHQQALCDVLRGLCLAHRAAGDVHSMLEVAPRWLGVARELHDDRAVTDARLQMGHAWFEVGELGRAKETLAAARQAAEVLGDVGAEQSARQELVRVLQACGRADEARTHAEALASSDRWWPRWSGLVSLAAIDEQVGELDRAQARVEEASAVVEEGEAPDAHRVIARAYVESNAANVLMARGQYGRALRRGEHLRVLAEQASLPDQMRESVLNAAVCHLRMGKLRRAGEHLGRLLEWATLSGDRRASGLARVLQSERLLAGGDVKAAKKQALRAVDDGNEAGRGHVLGEAELALGRSYLAEGRADDARYHLERCLGRAGKLQLKKLEVSARLALALTQAHEGQAGAKRALAEVEGLASRHGYEDLAAQAGSAPISPNTTGSQGAEDG